MTAVDRHGVAEVAYLASRACRQAADKSDADTAERWRDVAAACCELAEFRLAAVESQPRWRGRRQHKAAVAEAIRQRAEQIDQLILIAERPSTPGP